MRFDFDGEVEHNGVCYNRFQVQPNAGKIDSAFRQWREKNGGTHAVMGIMYVKKNGTKSDVDAGWATFTKAFLAARAFEIPEDTEDSTSATQDATQGSSSTDWDWWGDEKIWHRRVNGTDEWLASQSKCRFRLGI